VSQFRYVCGPRSSLVGNTGRRYAPGDDVPEAAKWANLDLHIRAKRIVRVAVEAEIAVAGAEATQQALREAADLIPAPAAEPAAALSITPQQAPAVAPHREFIPQQQHRPNRGRR